MFGESLYLLEKYLDYEEKLVSTQSRVESLSSENELLKGKVSSLIDEAKKTQDRLTALEKDVSTEKAFSKLKDKQIDKALAKLQKVGPKAVEKFKKSD